jgi:hypothetical protein
MIRNVVLLLVTLVGLAMLSSAAQAQLFGERKLGGSSLSRRPSLGQNSDRGRQFPDRSSGSARSSRTEMASGRERPTFEAVEQMIDEGARFIRGNREAGDFVGSDTGDVQSFVGMQQSGVEEEIRSAVDELVIEETPDVNLDSQPVIPPRMLLNRPRLTVGFDFAPRPASVVSAQLTQQVASKLSLDGPNWIEVSVVNGVAILRGEAVSEHDRRLAGILVGFEPGIARVQNEMRLASETPIAPVLPPAPAAELKR